MMRLGGVHQERVAQVDRAGRARGQRFGAGADRWGRGDLAQRQPRLAVRRELPRDVEWEPTRIRVGASSVPTSENRNSISSARPGATLARNP